MPTPRLRTARRAPNTELCELFAPIAAFLLRAGITKAELMAELRTAIDRVSRAKSGVPVVRIGVENLASSLVSRWMRDPKYLNHVGRPDDLPLNGTRSVASLLKADQVKISPTRALSLLLDLGTVKKVAPGRYRLVRRSMNYIVPDYLPFEPNFQFLVDAARACTWGSGLSPRSPRLYWLNACSTRVDSRHAPEFLRFSKERGLSFMHEINDWLEAHETRLDHGGSKLNKPLRRKRLGMSLFGMCSDASSRTS
jgi:hypothetical protein